MNQKEFINAISPFKDRVYRLAKRLLVSREEAEDATQEVIVKLWNAKEKLEGYNSVEAMAITMTKNYCLDQLKSKRASEIRLVNTNYLGSEPGPAQATEDKDSWKQVEKIIVKLPPLQRAIIQLRDVEEYEFSEIAKVIDMNESAIRTALSRARKTIREELTKMHSYGIKQD